MHTSHDTIDCSPSPFHRSSLAWADCCVRPVLPPSNCTSLGALALRTGLGSCPLTQMSSHQRDVLVLKMRCWFCAAPVKQDTVCVSAFPLVPHQSYSAVWLQLKTVKNTTRPSSQPQCLGVGVGAEFAGKALRVWSELSSFLANTRGEAVWPQDSVSVHRTVLLFLEHKTNQNKITHFPLRLNIGILEKWNSMNLRRQAFKPGWSWIRIVGVIQAVETVDGSRSRGMEPQ